MEAMTAMMAMTATMAISMDVGDATSTTSMDVVKVGLEKQVGLELEGIQG